MRYLCLLFVSLAWAEQLPMVVLSPRDGFAAGTIPRVVADSKGLVWFPHAEGLSRYDGSDFRSFTKNEGLPANRVSDIFERPDGKYWIAAQNHLCVFDPRGEQQ